MEDLVIKIIFWSLVGGMLLTILIHVVVIPFLEMLLWLSDFAAWVIDAVQKLRERRRCPAR